jgi:hypothetical protein
VPTPWFQSTFHLTSFRAAWSITDESQIIVVVFTLLTRLEYVTCVLASLYGIAIIV